MNRQDFMQADHECKKARAALAQTEKHIQKCNEQVQRSVELEAYDVAEYWTNARHADKLKAARLSAKIAECEAIITAYKAAK